MDNEEQGNEGLAAEVALETGTVYRLEVAGANVLLLDPPELSDVVMTNARLSVDMMAPGWRVTNDFALWGSSTLTHPPGASNGLYVMVGREVLVGAQAKIDMTGVGNRAEGQVTGRSGGSYGGLGENYSGSSNPTYGNKEAPEDLGTGGAGSPATRGGGAFRVVTPTLTLDGELLVHGQGGVYAKRRRKRGLDLVGRRDLKRRRRDSGPWRE